MSKGKSSGSQSSKNNANHHANQCNPNNAAHKAATDNHANQLNPNNSAYQSSRNSNS